MYHLKMTAAMAISAWDLTSVGQNVPGARNRLTGLHPRGNYDMTELQNKLSNSAKIQHPSSTEFSDASARWPRLDEHKVNVVVVPGTENDVAETVGASVPFLSSILPAIALSPEQLTMVKKKKIYMKPRISGVGHRADNHLGAIRQRERELPYLACTGAHGSLTTLGKMDQEMRFTWLNLTVSPFLEMKKTAISGGGAMSKTVLLIKISYLKIGRR